MAQEIADSKLINTWGSSGTKIEPDISKIIEGWQLGEQPPHEYMNWLQNTFGSKLNHILKNGVASWNNTTQYLAGASVQHSGNVWICETTNTNSEPTVLNANWEKVAISKDLTVTVDTIADLRSISYPANTVWTSGYHAKNDGAFGSHIFRLKGVKTTETDNGGTDIIATVGGTDYVYELKYDGAVNVKWFGAKGDGITDDTVAVQKAIVEAYHKNGKVEFIKSTYKILGTIILLPKTEIDFKNSTIVGGGMTSEITMFESGTMIDGIPTSNINTPAESTLVYGLSARNVTIKDAGTVFNFYNVLNKSELKFIEFVDCMLAIRLNRCFYASVENIYYWGTPSNTEQDSFTFIFENFINVLNLKNIACSMRSKGIQFRYNANGQKVENCTAESCGIGFEVFGGPSGPLEFDTCYFEFNEIGINFNGGLSKNPITVKNSWFYSNTVGISGDAIGGSCSVDIQSSNLFSNNTKNVNIIDNLTDKSKLSLRSTILSQNNLPSPLSGYTVSNGTEVDKMVSMYRTSDYRQIINSKDTASCIPFYLFGDSGDNIIHTIPFCTHTKTEGTSFSIHIDTRIVYREINNLLAYNFEVETTGQGHINFYGNIYGTNIKELSAHASSISISNNGGYLRISILNRTDTGGTYGITGIIRHI